MNTENKELNTKDVVTEENSIDVLDNVEESREVNDIENTEKQVFSDVYSVEDIEAAIKNV